jgi:hypothetical protein
MRITTYHKRVWKINHEEVIPAKSIKHTNKHTMLSYEVESDYVCVVYSETENTFYITVGYRVNAEKTIPNIIGLAVKLDVKSIKLIKCELIKHLKVWDHHVEILNKMLDMVE